MTETRQRSGITLDPLYLAVFGLFGWIVGTGLLGDNSFLWHLRAGDLIRDSGIPRTDVFSYTASDTPWVAQSWLAEVIYSILNDTLGAWSIRALTGFLAAATAMVAFETARRISGSRVKASVLTVPALIGAALAWNARPLMMGALLFAVLVATIELPESWLGRHVVWVLPPLIWLWINVHGSWMLGLAYLGVHLVGCWFEGRAPWSGRERSVLLGAGIGVLVSLANPYGFKMLLFPVELVGRGDVIHRIVEWQSPSARTATGIALLVWLAITIVALARGASRPGARDVLMTVVFFGLAFWAVRNVVIAPIVTLPIVARAWSGARDKADRKSPVNVVALAIIVLACVGTGATRLSTPAYQFAAYPVDAFDVLDDSGDIDGRVVTTDAWGGYMIWRYWPEHQVFMDDRYDMYPVEHSKDYFTLLDGGAGSMEILDDADADVVVWPKDSPLSSQLAASDGWVEVDTDDDLARTFVRP